MDLVLYLQGVAHFCANASVENAVFCSISQQQNDETRGDHARMLCFAAFLKGQIAKAGVAQKRGPEKAKGRRGPKEENYIVGD